MLRLLLSGKPLRMNELSAALGVVPRTITTMVDALEREGLVVRVPDPTDRRATFIEITGDGRSQLYQFRSFHLHSAAAGVFDGFSPAEKRQLATLLARVRAAIDAETDDGSPQASAPLT